MSLILMTHSTPTLSLNQIPNWIQLEVNLIFVQEWKAFVLRSENQIHKNS